MSDIREIVTKAVIGSGVKRFGVTASLPISHEVDAVLGSHTLNHKFNGAKAENNVEVTGSFDVHIWYVHDGNAQTYVVRQTIDYGDFVVIGGKLRDELLPGDEVSIERTVAPMVAGIRLESGAILVDVEFELLVQIIGETKMRVAILGPAPDNKTYTMPALDEFSEIDEAINTDFLNGIL